MWSVAWPVVRAILIAEGLESVVRLVEQAMRGGPAADPTADPLPEVRPAPPRVSAAPFESAEFMGDYDPMIEEVLYDRAIRAQRQHYHRGHKPRGCYSCD